MNLLRRIVAMFGHAPKPHDEDERVILDQAEGRIAGRLSRLTGKRRDEVLAESYRRADRILAGKRR